MFDFSNVKTITIPNGEVRSVSALGSVLWEKPTEPRLPNAYQEVGYLESTGTQYINTGFYPYTNCGFDLCGDFDYTASATRCGTRLTPVGNNNVGALCALSIGSNVFRIAYGAGATAITQFEPPQKKRANRIIMDGVSKVASIYFTDGTSAISNALSSDAFTIGYPFLLFAFNNGGTPTLSTGMSISNCKLYDNGAIIHDFVPCYRKSDGVGGMYDLVTKEFFGNAGTGKFLYEE